MNEPRQRRQRPKAIWADVRFGIGAVLVIAAIVGVWFVVSSARQTVPVYMAVHTLTPGESLADADTRIVEVALGSVAEQYTELGALTDGMVVARPIAAGELIPRSALVDAAALDSTEVVVQSSTGIASSVQPGSTVEVWSAVQLDDGTYEVPRILVAAATVVRVVDDDAVISSGTSRIEIVVPRAQIADVLGAVADDAAISVVPATGAAN